jgi:hypothetical protein
VLDALKARRIRMTDEEAQAVGEGKVTAEEVIQVLKRLTPGTSPPRKGRDTRRAVRTL